VLNTGRWVGGRGMCNYLVVIFFLFFLQVFIFLLNHLLSCDGGDSIAWYFSVVVFFFLFPPFLRWIAGLWMDWLDWAGDCGVAISSVKRDENTRRKKRR